MSLSICLSIHLSIQIVKTVLFQTIQFSISTLFKVIFQEILFSISTQLSFIWPIDRTLSGATTPGQNGRWSDGNEGVLRIPQSSYITGVSLSDCLVSIRTLVVKSNPSTELQ